MQEVEVDVLPHLKNGLVARLFDCENTHYGESDGINLLFSREGRLLNTRRFVGLVANMGILAR